MSKYAKFRVMWKRLVAGVVVCILLAPVVYYFLYIYAPGPDCFATPRILALNPAVRAGTAKIELKEWSDGEQGFLMRIRPTSEKMQRQEGPSTNAESGACFEYEAQKHSIAKTACDTWGSTPEPFTRVLWNDRFPPWARLPGDERALVHRAALTRMLGKMPRGSCPLRAIESNSGRFTAIYAARSCGVSGWGGSFPLGSPRRKPRGPFYHLLIDGSTRSWYKPAVNVPLKSYSRSTDESVPVGIGWTPDDRFVVYVSRDGIAVIQAPRVDEH